MNKLWKMQYGLPWQRGKFWNTALRNVIFYTEGCDSAIDYTLYDGIYEEKDGGQMDYNSERTNYDNHKDTIPDIIMFALSINRESIPSYYII